MKKIVFFDGDGTLWYPKSTKRAKRPYWIYYDFPNDEERQLSELILTPHSKEVLEELKRNNIHICIVSTNPNEESVAREQIQRRIDHLGLTDLIDDVLPSAMYMESKGEIVANVLKENAIGIDETVFVGDSYRWDYLSVSAVGVKTFLIESEYLNEKPEAKDVRDRITDLSEVLDVL